MRFGVFFPHQLPRPWTPEAEQKLFTDALDVIEAADEVGVQYAWAQEHHFLEEYSHSAAPEVFLAACSQRTRSIRLGHGVTIMPPAVNHPARVAERIATLDLVSGGRVEWGSGEMSSRIELEGFGINYLEKRAMWTEGLREATRMLAATPYPGYQGKYFSMPARNIVPKPVQRPHPPLWVACTNRDTLRLAARLGLGALTFAFMGPQEARFWVEEYYETFRRECRPLGLAVNPNVATLVGFHCSRDGEGAREAAERDQRFFKYGLAHYYRFGSHTPGVTNIWEAFERSAPTPMAGLEGVGAPDQVRERFEAFEAVGVDQLILLQQAGRGEAGPIIESLRLFGATVLPAFRDRDRAATARKASELAPYVDAAMSLVTPVAAPPPEPVEAYPSLWERVGGSSHEQRASRAVEATTLWNLHVGGPRRTDAG